MCCPLEALFVCWVNGEDHKLKPRLDVSGPTCRMLMKYSRDAHKGWSVDSTRQREYFPLHFLFLSLLAQHYSNLIYSSLDLGLFHLDLLLS